MTQSMNLGNSVQPLRNVAALDYLITRVEGRAFGLPGMAAFHGPPGYGKTYAAAFASATRHCIHISVQKGWTAKTLLKAILEHLNQVPKGTIPDMQQQTNNALAVAGRTLLIDETDYLIERGLIDRVRDIHDGSGVPVILIGMEDMPQNLRQWPQIDGRMLDWVAAEPADMEDARLLVPIYARGLDVADDLLQVIVNDNRGNVRKISKNLAHVLEQSRLDGLKMMDLQAWGQRAFLPSQAPTARRELM